MWMINITSFKRILILTSLENDFVALHNSFRIKNKDNKKRKKTKLCNREMIFSDQKIISGKYR